MTPSTLIRPVEPDRSFDALIDAAPDDPVDPTYVDWAAVARFLDAVPRSVPRSSAHPDLERRRADRARLLAVCRVRRKELTNADRVAVMRIGMTRLTDPLSRTRIGEALGLNAQGSWALYWAAFPLGDGDA